MGLEKRVCNFFSKNKSFILASGIYLSASLIDLMSTHYGHSNNLINEINPIFNESMKNLGLPQGLIMPKIFLTVSIITSAKYIDIKNKEGKTKLKAEYFLYPAALLTSLIGLSWIFDKYVV